ncbi:hypothetical protein [Halegenticoccus tardaugens]|uniref:hypothetical protein n=1 Tax=Halegenticoccus tardaugens TaxID=2071624 RepID=UPI00100A6CE9|nr:hypothetical protein [Halegenticoccus tardaugens]
MSPLDAIRRPEYTGERRCWPCTVVNAAIVAVVALLVAFVRLPAALFVLVAGGAAIALRGYVVPYTPRFAPAIAARLPYDFGHGDERRTSDALAEGELDPERLVTTLVDRGVFVDGQGGDLFLSDDFRGDWDSETASLRALSDGALADAAAEASPTGVAGRTEGEWIVIDADEGAPAWLSRPVAIAETAAVSALTARGLPTETAARAATPLRLFVEACPACGGDVVETAIGDCCGGTMGIYDTPGRDVLACESCEAVVYEFPAE